MQAKSVVEARLEQHEATLCGLVRHLVEIRDGLTAQVGQVNQSQQQAAPTPAPAPVPQGAVSSSGTPTAQQGLSPGYRTWQKRWGCSICWAVGDHRDWDRTTDVDKHARREHAGLVVNYIPAPRRPRN